MSTSKKYYKLFGASLVAIASVVVVLTSVSANAQSGGVLEKEVSISGGALETASAAAVKHTGGGVVSDTELGDEESYYEVEVSQDGRQTDVQLDENFKVVGQKTDNDS